MPELSRRKLLVGAVVSAIVGEELTIGVLRRIASDLLRPKEAPKLHEDPQPLFGTWEDENGETWEITEKKEEPQVSGEFSGGIATMRIRSVGEFTIAGVGDFTEKTRVRVRRDGIEAEGKLGYNLGNETPYAVYARTSDQMGTEEADAYPFKMPDSETIHIKSGNGWLTLKRRD